DAGATELVKRSAAIVAIAQTTASYIWQHIGRDAVVIHPPIYGEGPFAELGGLDNEFITLINPCAVKGVSIFEALAQRFPGLKFAVVPGWGATSADRARLERLANVTVLANRKNIEDILRRTRVLLAPSLWLEG